MLAQLVSIALTASVKATDTKSFSSCNHFLMIKGVGKFNLRKKQKQIRHHSCHQIPWGTYENPERAIVKKTFVTHPTTLPLLLMAHTLTLMTFCLPLS